MSKQWSPFWRRQHSEPGPNLRDRGSSSQSHVGDRRWRSRYQPYRVAMAVSVALDHAFFEIALASIAPQHAELAYTVASSVVSPQ